MILLFLQLLTSSSHAGDDMKDEDIWDLGGEPNTDCEDMDQEDLDGEDMDGEDWDGEDRDQEMDGDRENIGSNKGGSIDDDGFVDFCDELYGNEDY